MVDAAGCTKHGSRYHHGQMGQQVCFLDPPLPSPPSCLVPFPPPKLTSGQAKGTLDTMETTSFALLLLYDVSKHICDFVAVFVAAQALQCDLLTYLSAWWAVLI